MSISHLTQETMFEPLFAAAPMFERQYEQISLNWESETPSTYMALCALADHVYQLIHQPQLEQLGKIFKVVERWHVEGDPGVREAATIGFLENLQNQLLSSGLSLTPIEDLLGPASRRSWIDLQQFWHGDLEYIRD